MHGRDCRVLVVDDDDDIRETIISLLEDEGIGAAGAINGEQALTYLRGTSPPSFILLDLMMPIMDGPQFRAEQVRDGRLAAIPVVVLSGHAHARSMASTMGVAEVMLKPLTLDRLLAVVDRFC